MLASTLKNSIPHHDIYFRKAWRELYDVEMILRNIEGRRTIAASSFFPDRSRLATRRSYSLEKAKEYLKRVHIMEKRYIFTSSHLKIVQMMHIS